VALVVYPMNALVNSQLQALDKLRDGYEERQGPGTFPVSYAKYTGETAHAVRQFSIDGQVRLDGGRRLAPLRFCRQCGQDYYHVLQSDGMFMPHPVGTEYPDDSLTPGYLMLAPAENDWSKERIPDEWLDARGNVTRTWRDRVPQPVYVAPDGSFEANPREGSVKMWWQSMPLSLCLNCGEFHTGHAREFFKLASLSSEARSSATTALATTLLRRSRPMEDARDKLLSFTDNRQDASLQAGTSMISSICATCAHRSIARWRETKNLDSTPWPGRPSPHPAYSSATSPETLNLGQKRKRRAMSGGSTQN